MRELLLELVPKSESGVALKDLKLSIAERLGPDWQGSIAWHVTVVKLDLEARGLIERIPGKKPQHLRRSDTLPNLDPLA